MPNSLLLLAAAVAIIAVLVWLAVQRSRAVVLRTYSITGEIVLINECSGDGADNPASIEITVKLFYGGNTTSIADTLERPDVAMTLQADGVTSIGTYSVSGQPTNEKGARWELDFPDECAVLDPCDVGQHCTNRAHNTSTTVAIRGVNSTYNYRYECVCV